jgi:hypothetical protein
MQLGVTKTNVLREVGGVKYALGGGTFGELGGGLTGEFGVARRVG